MPPFASAAVFGGSKAEKLNGGTKHGGLTMRRSILFGFIITMTVALSAPAVAEDIRGGIWGGGKPNEGAEVSTTELTALLKSGAVVMDVGVNRVPDPAAKTGSRLVGDVAFAEVQPIAGKITPNPGGVGPMTIAMLMQNTVRAAEMVT